MSIWFIFHWFRRMAIKNPRFEGVSSFFSRIHTLTYFVIQLHTYMFVCWFFFSFLFWNFKSFSLFPVVLHWKKGEREKNLIVPIKAAMNRMSSTYVTRFFNKYNTLNSFAEWFRCMPWMGCRLFDELEIF